MKEKIQKIYHDYGFGFPVTLLHVPVIEIRGEWVPNVNQRELQERVIEALVLKPSRLSGGEVRFIRLFSKMTLVQFAERFDVTHPAVLKWERSKNFATGMSWTTEKDVRLFAFSKLSPKAKEFVLVYEQLAEVVSEKVQAIKIDCEKRSAESLKRWIDSARPANKKERGRCEEILRKIT
jgi:transcriptional regulator with XRE-family HTH domain